jgi:hypothetical protein
MKRVGNLMELIAAPENLRLAFWKAAKGKWSRPATRSFAEDFESRIARMSGELRAGSFVFGNYRRFRVFDPKERVIHAATHRLEPCFAGWQLEQQREQRAVRAAQQQHPVQRQQQQRFSSGPSATCCGRSPGPRTPRLPSCPKPWRHRQRDQARLM